jgi:DNA-directed RNA polymerase subunit RPC12/RpoP
MATCKFWKDQPDGFHSYCQHPEARPGDACILNTEDTCVLREFVCSECGRRVDVSSAPEADYYICEVCAFYVTVKPGAGIVPRGGEELEAVHTCAVCGHTMSSEEYEAKGCIFCGADSEESD